MKAVFIGLLLLSASVYTQSLGGGGSCSTTDNPFLKYLSTMGTGYVLSTPSTTGNWAVCNTLWSTSGKMGTCCDVTKMKSAFDNKMKAASTSFGMFVKTVGKVKNNIDKIRKVIGNKSAVKNTFDMAPSDSGLKMLTPDQAASILDRASSSLTSDWDMFKKQAGQCFKNLIKYRGRLFCYGCWAYGHQTIKSDGITRIKSTAATQILTDCAKTWRFIYNTQMMTYLVRYLKYRRNMQMPKPSGDPSMMTNGPAVNAIYEAFNACADNLSASSCSNLHKYNIIKAFFRVHMASKMTTDSPDEDAMGTIDSSRRLQSGNSNSFDGTVEVDDSNTSYADISMSVGEPSSSASVDSELNNASYIIFGVTSIAALVLNF